jgi:hypothetical protein
VYKNAGIQHGASKTCLGNAYPYLMRKIPMVCDNHGWPMDTTHITWPRPTEISPAAAKK